MKTKFIATALCAACMACGGPSGPPPVYEPVPIVDNDPFSGLARAVRAHNAVVLGQARIEATDQAILDAVHDVRFEPDLPVEITNRLERLEQQVRDDPDGYVDPRAVARIAALGHRRNRDTFYVLYGWLTEMEVERERPFVRALSAVLKLRGYRTVVDEAVTPDEWHGYLAQRDGAGLLWRSEGWFSRRPGDPHERIVARVWTTVFENEPKMMVFADDWARVLPEGLSFAAIASCGTAGPFLEDEVNILDDLGSAGELTFHTFHTELHDRTVFSRNYRSLLATSGYQFDRLSWLFATETLPDRSDLDPEIVDTGRADILRIVRRDESSHLIIPTLLRNPLAWIPLIIDEMESAGTAGERDNCARTLSQLAEALTAQSPWFDTAAQWSDWWNAASLQTVRQDAQYVAENAPPEVDLWIELAARFTAVTGYYRGVPRTGIHMEEYCWERWFRCLYADLSPWVRSGTRPDVLTRSAPVDDPHMCQGPLTEPFVLTWDPAAGTLTHNLERLITGTSTETVVQHCATVE